MDKVSVIIPIYNVEKYLKRCIDSVLHQSYPEVEILLIDDHSTDNSSKIASQYAVSFPEQCRYIPRASNGGLAAARNTGVHCATGVWLFFLDSDDWIDQNCLQCLVDTGSTDNADIVVCDYAQVWNDGKRVVMHSLGDLTTASSHMDKVAFVRNHACFKLYRRQFFVTSQLDYPEDLRRGEDMPVTVPLLTMTSRISIVNVPLCFYFQREGSISNTKTESDLSFYPKAVALMCSRSIPGFETELEYRCILELVYGMTMLMIRDHVNSSTIRGHLIAFQKEHPQWRKNPYIGKSLLGKRIFIRLSGLKCIAALRLLVWLYSRL